MAAKKKTYKKKTVVKRVKKEEVTNVDGVYQNAGAYAIAQFKLGNSETAITEAIREMYPILSEANIQFVLHKASKHIASQFNRDGKSIVSLHVKRYDQDITRLMDSTYDELIAEDNGPVDGAKRRKMRIYALMCVLETMIAKERVLQLHTKSTQVRVYNKLNAVVKERKIMFNLDTLSIVEKMDFLQLIVKAKITTNELFSVIQSTQSKEVTEEIKYEDLVNNNVDQITLINKPIIDKSIPKKNLADLKRKLQETMAKKAEFEFNKRGAGKGGPKALDQTQMGDKGHTT